MTTFDYVILGGGCAGLSLAYELDVQGRLGDKTLVIIEPRERYSRDKTWSFWQVEPHRHEDCVVGQWSQFSVANQEKEQIISCPETPYQTIDSGRFYEKVRCRLMKNPGVVFLNSATEINLENSLVFNSVPPLIDPQAKLFQHFKGLEIKTVKDVFEPNTVTLMDFKCDQRGHVHFFYVLPFSRKRALVETTWLGPLSVGADDYDQQIEEYLETTFQVGQYDVLFQEQGAIPLFGLEAPQRPNWFNIGTVGGMTRLSTGYAFLNIQRHSKFLADNIYRLQSCRPFLIHKRYQRLDKIFLRVLERHPNLMPSVFTDFFSGKPSDAISFLSGRGSFGGDLSTILQMPKGPFIRAAVGF